MSYRNQFDLEIISKLISGEFVHTGGGVYCVIKRFSNKDTILVISDEDSAIYSSMESFECNDEPLFVL